MISTGHNNLVYDILTIVEEFVEMAGIIAFIRALMIYYADNYKQVLLQFDPPN